MIYDVNLGIRDYFTYTDAMLNNSLFSDFLKNNGLSVYKNESTRDIICLDYEFGSRSYDDEKNRLEKLFNGSDEESQKRIQKTMKRLNQKKNSTLQKSVTKFVNIFMITVLT